MPDIDDLDVIRELLTGKPPSQDLNDYVKGRLDAVIAAAESHPAAGRPVRRSTRTHRAVATIPRLRRRRLALRPAAALAAALAAAAMALVVAGVPGAHHDGTAGPAVDTAYVVKHVDSALSGAGPGQIAQMTLTARGVPGGPATAEAWSYRGQWRSVTYPAAGHPDFDEGFSTASGFTVVSFQTRTWARGGSGRPGRPGVPGLIGCGGPLPVARALRAELSCVTLTEAGRQRVDGIDAIKLTSRPGSRISATMWVSPGTYLPLRVVIRPDPGSPIPWQEADITWLPPTAQNLARLTVPIPAGFRQVPLLQPAGPVTKYPGGPVPKSR
jgi:hypothetical protein